MRSLKNKLYFFNMCGTFSQTPNIKKMLDAFGVVNIDELPGPAFNIKPTSHIPVILSPKENEKEIKIFHWWLIYPFSEVIFNVRKDGTKSFAFPKGTKFKTHFNTKKETLFSKKPYWTKLLKKQRALIPASGFVEWPDDDIRDKSKDKVPHYFRLKNDEPFFFAAIWDYRVDDEGKIFNSCNIITGEPNSLIKKLPHKRSPIIFSDFAKAEQWIDSTNKDTDSLQKLLTETPGEDMYAEPIGTAINRGVNNSENVLKPLSDEEKKNLAYDWFN